MQHFSKTLHLNDIFLRSAIATAMLSTIILLWKTRLIHFCIILKYQQKWLLACLMMKYIMVMMLTLDQVQPISSPTKLTKAIDFIWAFEKKYKVWLKMMTTLSNNQQYYSLAQRPSFYKLLLLSQSEFFNHFQSQ